ncbi:MAG: L-amino acid N-acyltransferase YncA [Flavobacteriales bacterium]
MIRKVLDKDIRSITDIYNYYISETVVTFETETITPNVMAGRISNIQANELPWLVAEDEQGKVIGYAYADKWKDRFAYRFSIEVTVYLSPDTSGKGVGTKLYEALFNELRLRSVRSVIACIALPNPASIRLHEKFGLKKVGHFKEVGYKFDQWLDVAYWQGGLDS